MATAPSTLSADAQAALAVFEQFLDCIRTGDRETMLSLVLPAGSAALSRRPETLFISLVDVVERIPIDGSLGAMEELVHDVEVRVDDDIAMIWAPYTFLMDGKLHHEGTNIVSLLKRDGVWKMSGVADTSRPSLSS